MARTGCKPAGWHAQRASDGRGAHRRVVAVAGVQGVPPRWGQVAKGLRPIEGKQPSITRAARDSEIGESFGRKSASVAEEGRPR